MVDLKKLEELKKQILETDDFGATWNYFFDHFGENRDFIALGKIVRSPVLTAIFKRVLKEFFPDAKITSKRFKLLKKESFIHGSATFGHRLAVIIYFTDIEMGMLSFTDGYETKLLRFTSYHLKNPDASFPVPVNTGPH